MPENKKLFNENPIQNKTYSYKYTNRMKKFNYRFQNNILCKFTIYDTFKKLHL